MPRAQVMIQWTHLRSGHETHQPNPTQPTPGPGSGPGFGPGSRAQVWVMGFRPGPNPACCKGLAAPTTSEHAPRIPAPQNTPTNNLWPFNPLVFLAFSHISRSTIVESQIHQPSHRPQPEVPLKWHTQHVANSFSLNQFNYSAKDLEAKLQQFWQVIQSLCIDHLTQLDEAYCF